MTFTDQTSRRVYPLHAPLRSITRFAVKFTNTYQVAVDPVNIYINTLENWAEVVSIAAIISGVYPVGINFGLYTPIVEMDYTYGWQFPIVGEEPGVSTSSDTFQAANQFWVTTITPVVYIDGTPQTSGFTLNYTEGTVTFTTPPTANQVVTLDYTHRLPPGIAMATGHLTATFLNEGDLVAKGLGNLSSIRVEEIELRRTYRPDTTQGLIQTIDPAVAIYLSDYITMTVR